MMLYSLVKQHQSMGIESKVYSLLSNGEVKELIQDLGIEVVDLDFPKGKINIFGFITLVRKLHQWKPDVVQCWMYHANLIGGVAAKLAGNLPIVWSLHHTTFDNTAHSWMTKFVMKLGGFFSFIPKVIISCSEMAKDVHIIENYPDKKMVVIPNGFDISKFYARENVKKNSGQFIVGIVGRYSSQKDFPTFINAAQILSKSSLDIIFQFCGTGLDYENEKLLTLLRDAGIMDRVELLGRNSDMVSIYNGFDILVSSSSYGEAFPLVIGEAMACEIPCVATDVGDAKSIIGESGIIVPVKNPQAIADAVIKILSYSEEERNKIRKVARKKIVENNSIEWVASKYLNIYKSVMRGKNLQ